MGFKPLCVMHDGDAVAHAELKLGSSTFPSNPKLCALHGQTALPDRVAERWCIPQMAHGAGSLCFAVYALLRVPLLNHGRWPALPGNQALAMYQMGCCL